MKRLAAALMLLGLAFDTARAQSVSQRGEENASNADGAAPSLSRQRQDDNAISIAETLVQVTIQTEGPNHPDVAQNLTRLADLYRAKGRFAKAEPLYQHALAIWEKAVGPDHPNVAAALNSLAGLYYDQELYTQAEPLYKRSLAILEKTFGPNHPNVATALVNIAALYRKTGREAEAVELEKRVAAIRAIK